MAVFELKEYYNETATKIYLAKLHKQESVCYNLIYSLMGNELEPQLYNTDSKGYEAFRNMALRLVMKAQNGDKETREKYFNEYLKARYESGDYFHFFGGAGKADERLIMNFKELRHAVAMMTALLGAYSYISVMKVFACQKTNKEYRYKYDKIVVGYDRKNRDKIGDAILRSGINSDALRSELSAFYDIFIVKDKPEATTGYPVGIAKEVAGTSFSTTNSWAALAALSGKDVAEVSRQPRDTKFVVIDAYKACPNVAAFVEKLYTDIFFLT